MFCCFIIFLKKKAKREGGKEIKQTRRRGKERKVGNGVRKTAGQSGEDSGRQEGRVTLSYEISFSSLDTYRTQENPPLPHTPEGRITGLTTSIQEHLLNYFFKCLCSSRAQKRKR